MTAIEFVHLIFLVVLGQGVFLTIVLLTNRQGNRKANRLLSLAVFQMTYFTFVFLLNETGFRRYLPILIFNGFSIIPLIPVVFYFYFRTLLNEKREKLAWLHFVPFALQLLYWLPNNTNGLLFRIPPEVMSKYYSLALVRTVGLVHISIFWSYGYYFFKRISFHKLNIKEASWLKKIRYLYVGLVLTFTAGLLSIWFTETEVIRYAFFFFLSFFIYLIGYYGYRRSASNIHRVAFTRPKYFHSSLNREQSLGLYNRLIQLTTWEKPYLNPALRLSEMASQLGVSTQDLSRAINENFSGSFTDFMNSQRVEEAKRILSDPSKESYKMLAVASESGFGNKVSFYKNFKKFTGMLPVEFRSLKASHPGFTT